MSSALAARLKKACRWAVIVILCLGYPLLSHLFASSAVPSLAGALVAMAPLSTLALVLAWRSTGRTAMLALCLAAYLSALDRAASEAGCRGIDISFCSCSSDNKGDMSSSGMDIARRKADDTESGS